MFPLFKGGEGILYLQTNIQNCLEFYNTNIISLNTVTGGSNPGKGNHMGPAPQPYPTSPTPKLLSGVSLLCLHFL